MSKEDGKDVSSPVEMVDNISFQAKNLDEVVEQAHQQIQKIEKENQNAIENIQINMLHSQHIKQENQIDLDSDERSRQSHSNVSGQTSVIKKACRLLDEANQSISGELEAKTNFNGTSIQNSKTVVRDKEYQLFDEANPIIKEELDLDTYISEPSYAQPCTLIISTTVFDPNTLIGQPKLQFNPDIKPQPHGEGGVRKRNRPYPYIRPKPPEIEIPDELENFEFKTENIVPKIENACTHYDKEAEEIFEKERTLFFLCNTCSEEKNRKIIFPDGLTLAMHVTAVHQLSPQTTGPQFQFTCYGDRIKYHCFPVVQEVVFVCKYGNCPKRFTNDELLQNHVNTCHDKEEKTCILRCQYKLCGRRFPNQDKRRQHVLEFHIEHSTDLQDGYGAFWIIKSLPYGSTHTDQDCDLIQEDVFREIQRFFSHRYQLGRIIFIPSEDFASTLNEYDFMSTNMLPIVDPNDVELQRFEKLCSVTHVFEEIKRSDVDFLVNINNIKSRMLKGGVTIHNSDSDCVYFIDDITDFKEDQSETFTPIIKNLKPQDVEMDIGDLVFLYGKPDPNYSANEQNNFFNPNEEWLDGEAAAAAASAVAANDDMNIHESYDMLSHEVTGREDAGSTEDTVCKKEVDDDTHYDNPITISLEPLDKTCQLNERIGTFEKPDSVGKGVYLNVKTEALSHESSSPEQAEAESQGQEIKSEDQTEHLGGYTSTVRIKKFKTHNRFKKPPILDFTEQTNVWEEIKFESSCDTTENRSKATRKKSSGSKNGPDINVHTWNEEEIGSCISIPESRIKKKPNIIGYIRKSPEDTNSETNRSKNSAKTNTESEISATLEPETASLNKESEYSLQHDISCTESFSDSIDVNNREDGDSLQSISHIKPENSAYEKFSDVRLEIENCSMSHDPSAVQIKTENDIDKNQSTEMLENLVYCENRNESHIFSDENFNGSHDQSDDKIKVVNIEESQSNEMIEENNIFYQDINNSNDQMAEKIDMSCDQSALQFKIENKDKLHKMAAGLKEGRGDIIGAFDQVPVGLKMDQLPIKGSTLTSKHRIGSSVKNSNIKMTNVQKTINGAVENSVSINTGRSGISGHIEEAHDLSINGHIEESHDLSIDPEEENSAVNTVILCDKTVHRGKMEKKVFKESRAQFSNNMKMAKYDKSLEFKDKSGCHSLSKDSDRHTFIKNTKPNKDSALSVKPKKGLALEPFTQFKNLSNGIEVDTNHHQTHILHTSLAENVKINKRFGDKDLKYSESDDLKKELIELEKDKLEVGNSNKNTRNVLYQKRRANRAKIKPKHTTCVINGVEVKECIIKVFKMDQDDVEYICQELKHGHKTDYANYLYSMQKMDAKSYDQLVNGNTKLNMKRGKFKRILEICQNMFKTKKDLIDNPHKGVSDIKKRKLLSSTNLGMKKRKMNDEIDFDWLMEFDDSSSASDDGDEDKLLDNYDLDESDNDFICPEPECGRSFSNAERLDHHLSRKHGDNMYTERKFCPIDNCEKNYSSKGNLMTHIKKDHGEDAYKEIKIELYSSKVEEKKDETTVIRPAGTCLMPTIWRKPQPLIPPQVKDKITKTPQAEQPKNVREVEDIKNILSEFTQNGKGSFYSILSNK